MKVLLQKYNYRIVESEDEFSTIEELMGDCYNPEVNPDIDEDELLEDKKKFIRKVENVGVYGYVLEKWNPEIGQGWEHVDSCFGFVGTHESENHYIVEEYVNQIK